MHIINYDVGGIYFIMDSIPNGAGTTVLCSFNYTCRHIAEYIHRAPSPGIRPSSAFGRKVRLSATQQCRTDEIILRVHVVDR